MYTEELEYLLLKQLEYIDSVLNCIEYLFKINIRFSAQKQNTV